LYTRQLSTPFLSFAPAWMHPNLLEAKEAVLKAGGHLLAAGIDGPLVIAVTGKNGCVYNGAMEILTLLPHQIVAVEDLPRLMSSADKHHHQIYIVPVGIQDFVQRTDGANYSRDDFQQHPTQYRSVFGKKVAPYATVIINCVYWDARFPRLLTKQQMRRLYEKQAESLLLVADISCDVNGSIEFLERTTSIEKPFFQYDPISERVVSDEIGERGVTVMGVDILPTELPRESSEHFGSAVVNVIKAVAQVREQQPVNEKGVDLKRLSSGLVRCVCQEQFCRLFT
jgi:alpha-aminoadipic semialdehyde synthase